MPNALRLKLPRAETPITYASVPGSSYFPLLFHVTLSVTGCALPSICSWPSTANVRSPVRFAVALVNTISRNSPALRKSGLFR